MTAVSLEAMQVVVQASPASQWAEGLVLQELMPGTDVSIDIVAADGRLLAAACRTREDTMGGLCVDGEVFPLHGTLAASVIHLVESLTWTGIANIQAIVDDAGCPHFYEVNPRAAGSIGVNELAGFPLLAEALRWAVTGENPWAQPFATASRSVRFRRHWATQGEL